MFTVGTGGNDGSESDLAAPDTCYVQLGGNALPIAPAGRWGECLCLALLRQSASPNCGSSGLGSSGSTGSAGTGPERSDFRTAPLEGLLSRNNLAFAKKVDRTPQPRFTNSSALAALLGKESSASSRAVRISLLSLSHCLSK